MTPAWMDTSRAETGSSSTSSLGSRASARAEYDRIVAEADRKAARILEDAKKAAEQEREKTLEEARTQIAGLVMAATAKVLSESGEAGQSLQLYDQYLAKAGVTDESNRN